MPGLWRMLALAWLGGVASPELSDSAVEAIALPVEARTKADDETIPPPLDVADAPPFPAMTDGEVVRFERTAL